MAAQPIDLSGGLVTPPPTAPSPGGIDLSAGLAQVTPPQIADNPQNEGTYRMKTPGGVQAVPYSSVEPTRQMPGTDFADFNEYSRYTKDHAYDPKPHGFNGYAPPEIEQAKGAVKTAVQVPNTLVGWLDSITDKAASAAGAKNPEAGDLRPKLEKAENAVAPGVTNPIHGGDQVAGGIAETLAEWLYGEGEARAGYEALSQSQKLEKVAKAAKFIEEHPKVAAALRASAVAAGSGAQAAVHGATPGQAGEAALLGGGIAGAGEAVAGGVGAARTAMAGRAAAGAELEALPATRQAAAQGAVKDTIAETGRGLAAKINEGMKGAADFEPLQAEKFAAGNRTFGDLAQKTRDAVQPVIDKLDDASGGEIGRLQKLRSKAFAARNPEGIEDADRAIGQLVESHRDAVTPEEYQTWRKAYADSKTLDSVHQAVERSFNGISEEMAAKPGTSERLLRSGNSQGGTLQNNLGKLLNKRDVAGRVQRLIGDDGITNLYRASHLVSTPELRKATGELAEQVAGRFPNLFRVAGGAVGGGIGAAAGAATHIPGMAAAGATGGMAAGAALTDGARQVLRNMVMSPRVGQMMDFAVRNNVDAKIAAAAVAAQIQREQGSGGGG